MHVCPMVTGTVPHVGGPALPPGSPTVLIGGMPGLRVGDMLTCADGYGIHEIRMLSNPALPAVPGKLESDQRRVGVGTGGS